MEESGRRSRTAESGAFRGRSATPPCSRVGGPEAPARWEAGAGLPGALSGGDYLGRQGESPGGHSSLGGPPGNVSHVKAYKSKPFSGGCFGHGAGPDGAKLGALHLRPRRSEGLSHLNFCLSGFLCLVPGQDSHLEAR